MNEYTFATKRAYHGFLRLTRKGFASVGITAARFDMLLVIRESLRRDGAGCGVAQSELPLVLGVSKSVVSRMLASLEGLGLVQRFDDDLDGRCRGVMLTDSGEAVFCAAKALLMRSVQRVVVTAVCFGRHAARRERQGRLRALGSYLTALRVYLGDSAPLEYDWAKPRPWRRIPGTPARMLRDAMAIAS
jgi:DNA-binding MarR family transcriptional regulator